MKDKIQRIVAAIVACAAIGFGTTGIVLATHSEPSVASTAPAFTCSGGYGAKLHAQYTGSGSTGYSVTGSAAKARLATYDVAAQGTTGTAASFTVRVGRVTSNAITKYRYLDAAGNEYDSGEFLGTPDGGIAYLAVNTNGTGLLSAIDVCVQDVANL